MKKTLIGACLFQITMAATLLLISIGSARTQGVGAPKDLARDNDDSELREFIDHQVGGIEKLRVPSNNASIPVPPPPPESANIPSNTPDRYVTTEAKRFLGKMLFHDPVRTARIDKNQGQPVDLPAGTAFGGTVNGSDPNVQGQIRIVNASFATSSAPVGLQNGNGVLTLTRDRLNVSEFKGNVGGGTVTASGGMVYRPQVRFDLAMAAEGVRILYDQSIRTTLNSNLTLSGSTENALLTGQVGIEQLSFTSDFDLSEFMSQFEGDETPPPVQGFSQALNLDVGLQTPGGLNLTSRTLSLAGSANLHVRGTAAQPVLL